MNRRWPWRCYCFATEGVGLCDAVRTRAGAAIAAQDSTGGAENIRKASRGNSPVRVIGLL